MKRRDALALFFAQGLGIGKVPWAPGTLGSVLGFGWAALVLWPGSWLPFMVLTLTGVAASVWLSGEGERILGKTDPGSVVIDEIIAIPICLAGWVWFVWHRTGAVPGPGHLFSGKNWLGIVGVFALFRLFDIWKPWPVRQSQELRGGWGVTTDDCLAAVYVNVVVLAWLLWNDPR